MDGLSRAPIPVPLSATSLDIIQMNIYFSLYTILNLHELGFCSIKTVGKKTVNIFRNQYYFIPAVLNYFKYGKPFLMRKIKKTIFN